jgi:hypothetical protein
VLIILSDLFACFSANSFSSRMVGEVLAELLHQALKFYPDNDSWLKVLGDINFGKSSMSMRNDYYNEIYCSKRVLSKRFEELP